MSADPYAAVREAIERRCAAARQDRLVPYGELLRTNARETVGTMFPRYARRRGEQAMVADTDAFVRDGEARLAPFMHLATEFVRFVQPRLDDAIAKALVEYEWMQFSVEIDAAGVPMPQRDTTSFELNPTARLVALPFDANDGADDATRAVDPEAPPFVHVVYRTATHDVIGRTLTELDVAMLRQFSGEAVDIATDVRSAWIDDALRRGLVTARHP